MAVSDNKKKWWHVQLQIQNSLGNQTLATFATATSSANVTGNLLGSTGKILARKSGECSAFRAIPVFAFRNNSSDPVSPSDTYPGHFIFTLGSTDLVNCVVEVSTLADVTNSQNKRKFVYNVLPAYLSTDTTCSATRSDAPNTLDTTPSVSASSTVSDTSVIFRFAPIGPFPPVVCCTDLPTSDGTPLPPANPTGVDPGNPFDYPVPATPEQATRLWYIVFDYNDNTQKLYTYDIITGGSPTFRGTLTKASNNTSILPPFMDICWDGSKKLWGVNSDGIQRITPGNNTTPAYVFTPANITGFSFPAPSTFPAYNASASVGSRLSALSLLGQGGMSFNSGNGKLYFSHPTITHTTPTSFVGQFFELIKNGSNDWSITNFSIFFDITNNSVSAGGDFAFDPHGQCFCFTVDPGEVIPGTSLKWLSRINYTGPIGTFAFFTKISSVSTVTDISGIDYAKDPSASGAAKIYGIDFNGNLFTNINTSTGSLGSASSVSLLTGSTQVILGMTSNQNGDDVVTVPPGSPPPPISPPPGSPPVVPPTLPGVGYPMIILIDNSSFANPTNFSQVKTSIIQTLTNTIRAGDKVGVIVYGGSTLSFFNPIVLSTVSDLNLVSSFINSISRSTSSRNLKLCAALQVLAAGGTFSQFRNINIFTSGHGFATVFSGSGLGGIGTIENDCVSQISGSAGQYAAYRSLHPSAPAAASMVISEADNLTYLGNRIKINSPNGEINIINFDPQQMFVGGLPGAGGIEYARILTTITDGSIFNYTSS